MFEYLNRLPKTNDLIVLEILGKIVLKRPNDSTPQIFLVTGDADNNFSIPLKPFNVKPNKRKVWTYKAGFAP